MMQKQGYPEKNYLVPTKRYCQTLRLKDNPGLIAEYRKIHSRMEAWPEIRAGSTSSQKWKLMEWMFYLYE